MTTRATNSTTTPASPITPSNASSNTNVSSGVSGLSGVSGVSGLSALSSTRTTTTISTNTTTPTTYPIRRGREESHNTEQPGDRLLKRLKGDATFGIHLLQKQFRDLCKNPPENMSFGLIDDDITRWRIMITGPTETIFEGGLFPCTLEFPREYPNRPPVMKFETPGFWHPNVFKDGRVCISILHEVSDDIHLAHEPVEERWKPILGIDNILLSVISILADPNCDSPANIDASSQFKSDYPAYKKKVRALVRRSQEMD